ncbi:MAG TPA: hypothetical protein DDY86_11660 [Syntrophaceae bacterium]|nr:hypothetical protein [Syntrophaceae bacterium]
MTKDELEILLTDKPIEIKTRGAVLFNAVGATMSAYNQERSVANLRNMEAAKDAFDRFVAELGGGVSDDMFDNLMAVLEYLISNGWKAARNSLYRHQKQGKLLPESDGKYKQRAVDKYAKTFLKQIATGRRLQETSDEIQRQILQQNKKLKDIEIKMNEIALQKEQGAYLLVCDVKDAAFSRARQVRDALLNIPDRISSILAAETDHDRTRDILIAEIRQVLEILEKPEEIKADA